MEKENSINRCVLAENFHIETRDNFFNKIPYTYGVLPKNVSYIKLLNFDPAWFSACLAGSRQVTRSEAESYVPDRLWYCPSSAAKPVIESKYKLRPGPADLHLLVGKAYIYVWLESSYDPPECQPGQLAYKLSWFVSYRRLSSQFQFSLSAVTLEYRETKGDLNNAR